MRIENLPKSSVTLLASLQKNELSGKMQSPDFVEICLLSFVQSFDCSHVSAE